MRKDTPAARAALARRRQRAAAIVATKPSASVSTAPANDGNTTSTTMPRTAAATTTETVATKAKAPTASGAALGTITSSTNEQAAATSSRLPRNPVVSIGTVGTANVGRKLSSPPSSPAMRRENNVFAKRSHLTLQQKSHEHRLRRVSPTNQASEGTTDGTRTSTTIGLTTSSAKSGQQLATNSTQNYASTKEQSRQFNSTTSSTKQQTMRQQVPHQDNTVVVDAGTATSTSERVETKVQSKVSATDSSRYQSHLQRRTAFTSEVKQHRVEQPSVALPSTRPTIDAKSSSIPRPSTILRREAMERISQLLPPTPSPPPKSVTPRTQQQHQQPVINGENDVSKTHFRRIAISAKDVTPTHTVNGIDHQNSYNDDTNTSGHAFDFDSSKYRINVSQSHSELLADQMSDVHVSKGAIPYSQPHQVTLDVNGHDNTDGEPNYLDQQQQQQQQQQRNELQFESHLRSQQSVVSDKSNYESPLGARKDKLEKNQFQYQQHTEQIVTDSSRHISNPPSVLRPNSQRPPSQYNDLQTSRFSVQESRVDYSSSGAAGYMTSTDLQPSRQNQLLMPQERGAAPESQDYEMPMMRIARNEETTQQWSSSQAHKPTNLPPMSPRMQSYQIDGGTNRHQYSAEKIKAPMQSTQPIDRNNSMSDTMSNTYSNIHDVPPRATSPGVQQLSSMLMNSSPSRNEGQKSRTSLLQTRPPLPVPPQYQNVTDDAHSSHLTSRPHPQVSPRSVSQADVHDTPADSSEPYVERTACVQSNSLIMLRSYSTSGTIEARKIGLREGDNILAKQSGRCLGREEEIFEIQKVDGQLNEPILMVGDTVTLTSHSADGKQFGIHKIGREGVDSHYQVGFFSATAGPCEHWIILSNAHTEPIFMGRASMVNPDQNRSKNQAHAIPVKSGRPILLRNRYCGGILSIDNKGSPVILTDSYKHSKMSQKEAELIDRLQNHAMIKPTDREAFQIITSQCPPLPRWILGHERHERIFLSGSYLLHPSRNQRSAEFEATLFRGQSLPYTSDDVTSGLPPDKATFSSDWKERILLDEVIGSFLGLEGRHVRLKPAKDRPHLLEDFAFNLFNAHGIMFDVSLRNLVDQILPLSTSFVRVRNFVCGHHPGYEYGKVMHAFCESLDGLLQDYTNFVINLESKYRNRDSCADSLTMKSLYFQIMPSLHSMSVLENAIDAVSGKKGGALLNALHSLGTRAYLGDVVANRVLTILLNKAYVPYMEMLSCWVKSGILADPYSEFMISKNSASPIGIDGAPLNGEAWANQFTVVDEHVLGGVISTDLMKQKIVTSGKYWNAVQVCKKDRKDAKTQDNSGKTMPPMLNASDQSAISSYIDSMYQSASRELVRLLYERYEVTQALTIVKRYFLVEQGEFLTNFWEAAESELVKEMKHVSVGRVQHGLRTAIQQAENQHSADEQVTHLRSHHQSPCHLLSFSLRCRFAEGSLMNHVYSVNGGTDTDASPGIEPRAPWALTGVESLTIDFALIPFPLSLLLSRQSMQKYQLLFRQMFFIKHVERRLTNVWSDLQSLKRMNLSLRGVLGPTYLLRQKMAHFLQNLSCYMSFDVVESNWIDMQKMLAGNSSAASSTQQEQTVDDMLAIHDEFLRRSLDACLLTNVDLLSSLMKLLKTCSLFADQMERFMKSTGVVDENVDIAVEKQVAVQANLNVGAVVKGERVLQQNLARLKEESDALNRRQSYRVGLEVGSPSYRRMVHRFEEVFRADLAEFMGQLNSHTVTGVMANLGIRLDYNGYVTSSIR